MVGFCPHSTSQVTHVATCNSFLLSQLSLAHRVFNGDNAPSTQGQQVMSGDICAYHDLGCSWHRVGGARDSPPERMTHPQCPRCSGENA